MRKRILVACSVLVSASVAASTVNVHSAEIRIMSAASVRTACNGAVESACTSYSESALTCSCLRQHGRWAPVASIDSRPRMFTSSQQWLVHEMEHLVDFNVAMHRHADDIESRAFATKTACDAFAQQSEREFISVLRDFVRASTMLRDRRSPDRK